MNKVRVGLALGGGGARGYAHLGVLKVLHRASVPIDLLAGNSIGAVVGAIYAAGYDLKEMEKMARRTRWGELLRLADLTLPADGPIRGRRLEEFFAALIGGRGFAELEKPLTVTACDLVSGTEVRLRSGSLPRALRASTAVPGIFAPVFWDGRILVDGGVVNSVPLLAAAEMGPPVVIAVDVSAAQDHAGLVLRVGNVCSGLLSRNGRDWCPDSRPPGYLGIVGRSLRLGLQRNNCQPAQPEGSAVTVVYLRPRVGRVRMFDFQRVDECIAAGEEAGRLALPQLQKLLEDDLGA